MHYTAIIERCNVTGLYVGYVPGLPGAHSQGETAAELNENLCEVIGMLVASRPEISVAFASAQQIVDTSH